MAFSPPALVNLFVFNPTYGTREEKNGVVIAKVESQIEKVEGDSNLSHQEIIAKDKEIKAVKTAHVKTAIEAEPKANRGKKRKHYHPAHRATGGSAKKTKTTAAHTGNVKKELSTEE